MRKNISKKKRIKKKWYVYILKAIDGKDQLYKVWCCYKYNLKNRLRYWRKKYLLDFDIYCKTTVEDIFKEENKLLWYLRWRNKWLPDMSELFLNCWSDIEEYLIKNFITKEIENE